MSLAYKIALLAKQLCCYRANPLQFFDESAGATLTKKGVTDGARLVLTDDSTYLGSAGGAASGEGSAVGGGTANTASGDWSVVSGGQQNTASGNQSSVIGGDSNEAAGANSTVLGGSENGASGVASVAMGVGAVSRHYGEFAQSNGGLAQHGSMVASAQTTNATPVQVTLNGTDLIQPTTGEVWGLRARVSARCAAASKAFVTDLEFAVTAFGGVLTQLGSTEVGFSRATGSTTYAAAVYVASDGVSVTVTGAVGESVDWAVDFWYCKVGT